MGSRRMILALGACFLTASLAGIALAQAPADLNCGLEAGPKRAVTRIIDGATLQLDDRTIVRLVGLIPPRAEDAGAQAEVWEPERDARSALANFAEGRTVSLAFHGPRSDRYGRVLAHVFVDRPRTQPLWLQAKMVADGHSRVFSGPENGACIPVLLAAETEARAANRGLWRHAAYHLRPAEKATELVRYAGTFQVVAGRVKTVGGSRQTATIDLESAERGSRGLRLIARRSNPGLQNLGPPRRLVGQTIVARGWIAIGAGGPEIEIVADGQIQIIIEPVKSAPALPLQSERPATSPPGVEDLK